MAWDCVGTCYGLQCPVEIEQGEVFCAACAALLSPGLLAGLRSIWVTNQQHTGQCSPQWHKGLMIAHAVIERASDLGIIDSPRKRSVRMDKKVTRHECHAKGCSVPVRPALLMCPQHWCMVPPTLQRRVWAEYREGQEVSKDPSKNYVGAAVAAIRAVAEKEGRS